MIELPTWYDVDDHAALCRLVADSPDPPQVNGLVPYRAPATAAVLGRIGVAAGCVGQAAE